MAVAPSSSVSLASGPAAAPPRAPVEYLAHFRQLMRAGIEIYLQAPRPTGTHIIFFHLEEAVVKRLHRTGEEDTAIPRLSNSTRWTPKARRSEHCQSVNHARVATKKCAKNCHVTSKGWL